MNALAELRRWIVEESLPCWSTLGSALANVTASALLSAFPGQPFSGGWVDPIDASLRPLVSYVPASTLYHLLFAVAESDKMLSAEQPGAPAARGVSCVA